MTIQNPPRLRNPLRGKIHHRRTPIEIVSVVAAVLVGVALTVAILVIPSGNTTHSAPVVPTSYKDTAYLTTLAAENVGVTSPGAAITMGHNVCQALDLGTNRFVEGLNIVNVGYQPHEAAVIVGASVANYCQDHAGSYANQRGY